MRQSDNINGFVVAPTSFPLVTVLEKNIFRLAKFRIQDPGGHQKRQLRCDRWKIDFIEMLTHSQYSIVSFSIHRDKNDPIRAEMQRKISKICNYSEF